ncbi:MAG: hypothetical protein MR296_03380 [Tenericutes bacterium]|nr:hypothetical protein [Mycoplasmatota bacterium]
MNNILVKVFTLKNGLECFGEVSIVRIKSKDYNLLIMKDYMPIIGEIDGNLEIEGVDINKEYKNIKGYYMHYDNTFNIIIEGE